MMRIGSAHLWVHDQETALKFWTEKVGMEVREDVSFPEEMGDFRWLTVGRRVRAMSVWCLWLFRVSR